MNYNYLSKLNDQNKIISSNIKKKNIHRLINLIKNYDLNEKNQDNVKNFLLKLAKKKNKNFINIKILIVSNLSLKIFEKILIEKLLLSRIGAEIFFSDYNETLNMEKKLGKFDYIFIYPNKTDFNEISKFSNNLNYNLRDLKTIKNFYEMLFKKVKHFSTGKVFLSNILPYVNSEFGNYTRLVDNNKFEMIDNLNFFILEKAKNYKFYFFDNCFLSSKFGLNGLEDLEKFYLARIPFSQEYANYFFSVLSNAISVSLGRLKKVLVLDLDNTIWGGILGDDGYEKIVIGSESPIGLAYSNFQQFILNLKKRGVLLAICSKNLFENVKNAFQKNKNLILKIDDFVSIKANWNDKANNIVEMSKELNLGLDSFVFMDDSPVERELIRSYLPSVEVPELPEDPSYYKDILLDSFAFDIVNFSKEDLSRSKTYLSNSKRKNLKKKFDNIDDYMKSLQMSAECSSFKRKNYDRVVQLFQRSNQFNFTTIRYSLGDIQKFEKNKSNITMQVSFNDKFSKYGIISLIIGKINNQKLEILNWVMSCRVINRTLENFIINKIYNICRQNKLKEIVGVYKQTQKNSLVKNLYEDLGFKIISNNHGNKVYKYDIKNHKSKKTPIKEIK